MLLHKLLPLLISRFHKLFFHYIVLLLCFISYSFAISSLLSIFFFHCLLPYFLLSILPSCFYIVFCFRCLFFFFVISLFLLLPFSPSLSSCSSVITSLAPTPSLLSIFFFLSFSPYFIFLFLFILHRPFRIVLMFSILLRVSATSLSPISYLPGSSTNILCSLKSSIKPIRNSTHSLPIL